ncbi:MAG: zinc-ribbon domain-containing protein, partial [Promethearchaeota archaeon]
MYCTNCGSEIKDPSQKFCEKCGSSIPTSAKQDKNATIPKTTNSIT